LPGDEEPPLVLDGGTCILADYQRGEQFDALQELIPAAFFKSMGYTGVASALGGVFVGQSTERARQVAQRWRAARHGALVLVVDAGLFVPLDELRRGMDELVRGVRQDMQPVRGHEEAALPGTLEHRREREYLRDGIPMDLRTLKHLERAGIELGVAVPWS
jgi:LDH2 family malate/lactate/ureidoglycolate dehydrogenase